MVNCIPNKKITINERDAPWVTPEVKTALCRNKRVFKKWIDRGRPEEGKASVNQTQRETNKIILNGKKKYATDLGEKICNPRTGPKCFWTAFKKLLINNKNIQHTTLN